MDRRSLDNKCCDNCKWYGWYWDRCERWQCEVNRNSRCNGWETKEIKKSEDK